MEGSREEVPLVARELLAAVEDSPGEVFALA